MTTYKQLGTEIGELADRKAEAYGDSIARSVAMLQLLYPTGLRPDQYLDAILAARDFDKRCRLAQGAKGEEDPRLDICGYALVALLLHRNEGKEPAPCLNDSASGADAPSITTADSASHPASAPAKTAETASPSSASDSPTPSMPPSPDASPATDASANTAQAPASSPAPGNGSLEARLQLVRDAQHFNDIKKCGYCNVTPPSYWPMIQRQFYGGLVRFCSAICDNSFSEKINSL